MKVYLGRLREAAASKPRRLLPHQATTLNLRLGRLVLQLSFSRHTGKD